MQLRIIKRVPIAEVRKKVKELEKKYGGKLDDVSDRFSDRDIDREVFEEYVDWMGMEQALGAYGEGEEFDYFTEELQELGEEGISKLTPRRLELLDQMSRHRAQSINGLASSIGRDVKNVYNDLRILETLGFVGLVREGRRLVPDLLVKEITFLTW